MRARRLVFLHLHKTGGTSIHQLLAAHLPPESLAARDGVGNIVAKPESVAEPVISGHVTASYVRALGGTPGVFTVLREPRERLLSQIYFLKGYTQEYLETYANPRAIRIKAAPIADLVRHDNQWARDYYLQRLDPLHDPADPQSAPDLDRALAFLESCTVVGVTARLAAFVRAAMPHFGIASDVEAPFANRRQDLESRPGFEPVTFETLSDEDEAAIADLTRNDRLLYERALSVAPA